MRGKTKAPGYHLHPVLVGVPVAFYTLTFLFMCIYATSGNSAWHTASYFSNIAAVATALLAALPGFVEWLNIPSGKKIKAAGVQQLMCSVTALILLCINLYIQNEVIQSELPSAQPGLILSGTSVMLIMIAGILGLRGQQGTNNSISFAAEERQVENL